MIMSKNSIWLLFALFGVLFLATTLGVGVHAYTYGDNNMAENEITKVLCAVINLIIGPVGRSIAILIVISLAIALFLGKVTWGLAIAVAVGMGLLFGAPKILENILGMPRGAEICPKHKLYSHQ